MRTYNYNKEIRIILSQVLNALDGIILKRFSDVNYVKTAVDSVKPRIVYSPKTRVIYDLVNKNQHLKLPVLAMTISGISHDKERIANKHEGIYSTPDNNGKVGPYLEPVPIKITLDTSFLCKYQNDADQYVSCILANLNPYIIISYKNPVLETKEVRIKVEKSSVINFNYPRDDIDASNPYRMSVDLSLTCSAWIFKSVQNPIGQIYSIPMTWTSVDRLSDDYDDINHQINSDHLVCETLSHD